MTKEKRDKIIRALVLYPTKRDACKAAGISERSLYNYMQDDDFMKEYRSVIDEILSDTDTRLREGALLAVNHLISVVTDQNEDVAMRLKADRIILDYMMKKNECDNKYW